jgi:transketolase
MRTAFIHELTDLARSNPNIFLIVGDLGFSVVEKFADEFPDRFLNAGVAEQNMTGVAAGLASEGYHVFTYSIANFPTTRCLEQIRNDICYHNLNATIVSVGGGVAYGNLGFSHHAIQDYAIMRGLPNMRIFSPGDPFETRAVLRAVCDNPGPSYLRLGKNGEPCYHKSIPFIKEMDNAFLRVAGPVDAQNAILSTGASLECAVSALSILPEKKWSIWSLPVWSKNSQNHIKHFIAAHSLVVSIEEHMLQGGFGSFLRECLDDEGELQSKFKIMSLDDIVCGLVGSQKYLCNAAGLGAQDILRKAI